MDDENNDYDFESAELTDSEIIGSIWLEPKFIFEYLIQKNYRKWVLLLIVLGGISGRLAEISNDNYADHFPFGPVVFSIIGGAIFGWIGYYIFSFLVSWTGKWIDGTANSDTLLLVIAYAQIPIILAIAIYALELILFNTSQFTYEQMMALDMDQKLLFFPLFAVELVLSVWSIVLLVVGVSVAQNFSIGKSILNLLMPVLLIGIPLLIFFVFLDML